MRNAIGTPIITEKKVVRNARLSVLAVTFNRYLKKPSGRGLLIPSMIERESFNRIASGKIKKTTIKAKEMA